MATQPAPTPRQEDSLKETLESIVIAFVLAFVFRAYVVEAFVIPTGSMAPTLLGQHVRVTCEQCGYTFKADWPQEGRASTTDGKQILVPLQKPVEVICPMCHFPNVMPGSTTKGEPRAWPRHGDRILVHKYIYSLHEPTRWDVVVFKNPQSPEDNFIKRLVGLPGEELFIIDGNVYIRPLDAGAESWHIARKADRLKVQQAVWQPVFDSAYLPMDLGQPSRQRMDQVGQMHPWQNPWAPDQPEHWRIAGRRSYRYDLASAGTLHFDFLRAVEGTAVPGYGPMAFYPFNQFRPSDAHEAIEDVRLSVRFLPQTTGLAVTLQTTSRLDQPDSAAPDLTLRASIDAQGAARLEAVDAQHQVRLLAQGQTQPLPVGVATPVELWYVDQQALLWVNGEIICQWRFELPLDTLRRRPPPQAYPQLSIGVSGAPVELLGVKVDRDLYYSASTGTLAAPGLGTLLKRDNLRLGEPVRINPDRFFCLGDNSPSSNDGRFWSMVDEWVRHRYFHAGEQQEGLVPRELMIGRAFFVYFPAPLAWQPTGRAFVPNFGELRFIH